MFDVCCSCWCWRLPSAPEWMRLALMLSLGLAKTLPSGTDFILPLFQLDSGLFYWSPAGWWQGTGEGNSPWFYSSISVSRWACVSGLWPSHGLLSFFPLEGEIGNPEQTGGEVSGKVFAPGEYIFVVQSAFCKRHSSACSARVKGRSFLTLHQENDGLSRGKSHKCVPPRSLQPPGDSPSHAGPRSTSASSSLSDFPFQCFHWWTAPSVPAPGKQISAVTFWLLCISRFQAGGFPFSLLSLTGPRKVIDSHCVQFCVVVRMEVTTFEFLHVKVFLVLEFFFKRFCFFERERVHRKE